MRTSSGLGLRGLLQATLIATSLCAPSAFGDVSGPRIVQVSPAPTTAPMVLGHGLSRFTFTFNRDVTVPAGAVTVTGLPGRALSNVTTSYDPVTRQLTVSLEPAERANRLQIVLDYSIVDATGAALDGETTTPLSPSLPTGDGRQGGQAVFVYNTLAGDFDRSGMVSMQDLFSFLEAWFQELPSSDFNQDGFYVKGYQDLFEFLTELITNKDQTLPPEPGPAPTILDSAFHEGASPSQLAGLVVHFANPINPSTASARAVVVTDRAGGLHIPSSVRWSEDNQTATFGFSPPLDRCDEYQVSISNALTADNRANLARTLPAADINFLAPPGSPTVSQYPASTRASSLQLSGQAPAAASFEVATPSQVVTTPTAAGAFSINVPLDPNRINPLFVTAISPCGIRSAVTPISVTQDGQPPSLAIDVPSPNAQIQAATTDVAGRVADLLSGFDALTVTVNGQLASRDVGNVDNGTFFYPALPLNPTGPTNIEVVARDALGNTATRSLSVSKLDIPAGSPRMEIISGNGQAATVGTTLPMPVVIRMLRGDGSPFSGKLVTFTITRSDGQLSGSPAGGGGLMYQAITDASGLAAAYWTLGSDAGSGNNRVEVVSRDIAGTIQFCASGLAQPADQINFGDAMSLNQVGEAGAALPIPLSVFVSDGQNGIGGVPVTFRVTQGGGSFGSPAASFITVNTSPTGRAAAVFTLGTAGGQNEVEATFPTNPGLPVVFTARGLVRDIATPTTFVGEVFDNAGRPIGGCPVTLAVNGVMATPGITNSDGRFTISQGIIGGGSAVIMFLADQANQLAGQPIPAGSFPIMAYNIVVVPNTENSLPMSVMLPQLNPNNRRTYNGTQDVILNIEGVEGVAFKIKAGTVVRTPAGITASLATPVTLSLDQVHFDKVPMPLPNGAAIPFAWTLQPKNTTFDPPIEVTLPNFAGLTPGSVTYIQQFNHIVGGFENVGAATVSADGAAVKSDPGSGIYQAGWGGFTPPPPPPTQIVAPVDPDPSLEIALKKLFLQGEIAHDTIFLRCAGSFGLPCPDSYAKRHLDRFLGVDGAGEGDFSYSDGDQPVQDILDSPVFQSTVLGSLKRQLLQTILTAGVPGDYSTVAPGFTDDGLGTQLWAGVRGVGRGGAAITDVVVDDDGDYSANVSFDYVNRFELYNNVPRHDKWPLNWARDVQNAGQAHPFNMRFNFTTRISGNVRDRGPTGGGGPSVEGVEIDYPFALDGRFTATAGGRTVRVRDDGSFVLDNLSSTSNRLRVRFASREFYGESEFLSLPAGTTYRFTNLGHRLATRTAPLAAAISLNIQPVGLVPARETRPLHVLGLMNSGQVEDLTEAATGTDYVSSNPRIVGVSQGGVISADDVGTAFVTATNEGATATVRIDVVDSTVSTTVHGFVFLPDGAPASAANVRILPSGLSGITASDGSFSLNGTFAVGSAVSVVATQQIAGQQYVATVSGLQPAQGQILDAGVLQLRMLCNPVWEPTASCLAGVDGFVNAITWHDFGEGTELVVGGSFTRAGCISATNIARWNGTQWRAVGSGISSPVSLLESMPGSSGGLFAAVNQYNNGYIGTVHRWIANQWTPIGTFDGSAVNSPTSITSMKAYPGLGGASWRLYVGGTFTRLNTSTFVGYMASWAGTWTNVGGGVSTPTSTLPGIFALHEGVFNGQRLLFVGGDFQTVGSSIASRYAASWNGVAWASLPGFDNVFNGLSLLVGTCPTRDTSPFLCFYSGVTSTAADEPGVRDLQLVPGTAGGADRLFATGNLKFVAGGNWSLMAEFRSGQWSTVTGAAIVTPTVEQVNYHFDPFGGCSYDCRVRVTGSSRLSRATVGGTSRLVTNNTGGQGVGLRYLTDAGFTALPGGETVFTDCIESGGALYVPQNRTALLPSGVAQWTDAAPQFVPVGRIPDETFGGAVRALAQSPAGTGFTVGGSFDRLRGVAANNLVHFDGSHWTPLGAGLPGVVNALKWFDDGSGAHLYAGGGFTTVNGSDSGFVARWNGASWESVGTAINGPVQALEAHGGELYAGGSFAGPAAQPLRNVAKWSGAEWLPVGSGLSGTVYYLKSLSGPDGPSLYACGSLTASGPTVIRGVAWLNGAAWEQVGNGISGTVRAVEVYDDGTGAAIFAAGDFLPGGILRWNWLGNWSSVTAQVPNGSINSLLSWDDGAGQALYALGTFNAIAGVSLNQIGRLTGTAWTPLGTGVGGTGYCLLAGALPGLEGMFCGGSFATAGGGLSPLLARWYRPINCNGGIMAGPQPGSDDPSQVVPRSHTDRDALDLDTGQASLVPDTSVARLPVSRQSPGVDGSRRLLVDSLTARSRPDARGRMDAPATRESSTPKPVVAPDISSFSPATPASSDCRADFNNSGPPPDVQDLYDFFSAYLAGDVRADFNRDGSPPNLQDLLDFVTAYFAECP